MKSEVYRMALTVEYGNIKARTAWMRQAVAVGRTSSAWLSAISPLSGLLFGKRRSRGGSLVGKLVFGWRLAQGLSSLWKARKSNADPDEDASTHSKPLHPTNGPINHR